MCKELGFILAGSVRLYHLKDGEEITEYFCQEHEFISSYKSFLKQLPSVPSIQALEDLLLITLKHQALTQLYDNPIIGHKMERFGRRIAEELISCYEDRVLAFVTKSPEERYTSIIRCNPSMLQHIPQRYLANYLGITAVSLSRIRKRIVTLGK